MHINLKNMNFLCSEEEKKTDGQEKEITFAEFLDRKNKLALKSRREEKEKQKEARNTLKRNTES